MPFSPVAAALVLVALALPVSIAATNVALALLALALIESLRRQKALITGSWSREPVLLALLAYAAAGSLSAALCPAPPAALRDALKDLHRVWALGLFTAALALAPEAPVLPALGLSLAAAAAFGISQSALGGVRGDMMVRAHAFTHPVVFGEMMALAVLGGACLLLRPESAAPRRGLTAAFTVLSLTALVLSQTRMALFAAAFGFAAVAFLEPRARRWILPVLALVAAAAAAWEFLPTGGRTLSAILRPYDPNSPHQARWALWSAAWKMFRDHPLFGVGPGGYRRLFQAYHPGALDGEYDWGSAHNLYVHQLAERGVLGGLVLFGTLAALARRAARAALESPGAGSFWAAAGVAVLLAMSVTETSFQNEQFATLLLLIWAYGTAALRRAPEVL